MSFPEWLEVRTVRSTDHRLSSLDPGEQEAILLADEIRAEAVLLDEKAARNAAEQRGIPCIGTLRILSEGAKQGQIGIHQAVSRLRQTTFRAKPALFERAISGSL
jgi:predicted nucleic acid-binding protein